MIFNRIYYLLFESPIITLYLFLCSIIFCIIYQVGIFIRAKKRGEERLPISHFVYIYIFLFYLMIVYTVTGMGTIWIIGRYETLIRMDQIHLIPFGTFESPVPYLLNILMTIPLGFLLPFIWPSFRSVKRVALTGLGFSLAIELSQLLNLRGTTTDDLIMNTLGAVIGYFIFKYFNKFFQKNSAIKSSNKPSSFTSQYEPIIYLVCSFVGVFILYHPEFAFSLVDQSAESRGGFYSEYTQESITGNVVEVLGDKITVDLADSWETEEDTFNGEENLDVHRDEKVSARLSEMTKIEIWQTNAAGTSKPIISEVTLDKLTTGDQVTIYGQDEGDNFIAEHIVIWKFDQ